MPETYELSADHSDGEEEPRTRPRRRCLILLVSIAALVLVVTAVAVYIHVRNNQSNGYTDDNQDSITSEIVGLEPDNPEYMAMTDRQKYYFNIGVRIDKDIRNCQSEDLKYSFPNLDYAFLGYDILRGYPLAESHDPGFTHSIFAADYSDKVQSADCRYALPNGVLVIPDVSCVTSFSSTEITSEKELAESLAVTADVSGGGYGASFSASAGYKKAKETMEKEDSVLITSSAHCDYYFVKLRKEIPPAFHPSFLLWISKLDKADMLEKNQTQKLIMEFFDKFGTHFLSEVTFGARFTYEHKMHQSSFKSMSTESIGVAARASYSGTFSVGGGFSLDKEQRDAAFEFSKKVKTRTVTVGAAPPPDGSALTWASTVQNNPVPTKYKLLPIEDLFVEDFLKDTGVDYDYIRQTIIDNQQFYKEYRENKDKRDILAGSNQDSTPSWEISHWHVHEILMVDGGPWGSWRTEQFCPEGTYAIGYDQRIEPNQGSGDDTGLNAIKLFCADKNGKATGDFITSGQQKWGAWASQPANCQVQGRKPYFMNQFSLQFFDYSHIAAVFVKFTCQDLSQEQPSAPLAILPGYNADFGRFWHSSRTCPPGTAICGIKTKIEKEQGTKTDDTALNNVKMYCCGY